MALSDELLEKLQGDIDVGALSLDELEGTVRTQLQGHRLKKAGETLDENVRRGVMSEAVAQNIAIDAPGALQEARREPSFTETVASIFYPNPEADLPATLTAPLEQANKTNPEAIKAKYTEKTNLVSQAIEDQARNPLSAPPIALEDVLSLPSDIGDVTKQGLRYLVGADEDIGERQRGSQREFLRRTGQPLPPELEELEPGGNVQLSAMGDITDPIGAVESLFALGRGAQGFKLAGRTALDASLGVAQSLLDRIERLGTGVDFKDLPPLTPEEILLQAGLGTVLGLGMEGITAGIGKGGRIAKQAVESAPGGEIKTGATGTLKQTEAQVARSKNIELVKKVKQSITEQKKTVGELNTKIQKSADSAEQAKLIEQRDRIQARIDKLTQPLAKPKPKIEQPQTEPKGETAVPPEAQPPYNPPEGKVAGPSPKEASPEIPKGKLRDPEGIGRELDEAITPEDEIIKVAPRGKRGRLTTQEGEEIEYEYALLDPDEVISSHDINLVPRKDFPAERQPRDRTRTATEDQLLEITNPNKFDPRRLIESTTANEGAPILDNQRIDEAGNVRQIALLRIKKNNPELWKKYRDALAKRSDVTGITQEILDANPDKALYRIRKSKIDAEKFARQSNTETALARSAPELAREDAGRINPEILKKFKATESGDFSESVNREFITDFLNTFSATERARFMTKEGALSAEGKKRIRNAVFAKAFDDIDLIERVTESVDSQSKNITGTMLGLAPKFASLKEGIKSGDRFDLDITGDMVTALRKFEELKSAGTDIGLFIKNEGKELFGKADPLVLDIIGVFDKNFRSQKKLMDVFNEYLNIADAEDLTPRQRGLAGDVSPTKQKTLETAIKRSEGESASLFSKGQPAKEEVASVVPGFNSIVRDTAGPILNGGNVRETGSATRTGRLMGTKKIRAIREAKKNTFSQIPTKPSQDSSYNALSKEQVDRVIEVKQSQDKTKFWEVGEQGPEDIKKATKKTLARKSAEQTAEELADDLDRARKTLELREAQDVNTAILDLPELVEFFERISNGRIPLVKNLPPRRPGEIRFGYFDPNSGNIVLNANIFNDPKQAMHTLAHELGHWIDWFPDGIILKGEQGGDMIARMASIKGALVTEFNDLLKNAELVNEARRLSWTWRPFDIKLADAEFIDYRSSGAELYADFNSALYNNPNWVKKEAPNLYNLFFEFMDKKPGLRQTYEEIITSIQNGTDVDVYIDGQLRDYQQWEARTNDFLESIEQKSLAWEELAIQYFDFQYGVLGRRAKAIELAKKLDVEFIEDPEHALQELNYEGAEQELFAKDHWSKVIKPLEEQAKKADMPVDEAMDRFGVAQLAMLTIEGKVKLTPKEILDQIKKAGGDPADFGIEEFIHVNLAMPGGLTQAYAKKVLKRIAEQFGVEESFLWDKAKEFRKIREEFILSNPELKRMWHPDTLRILEEQEFYVALDVTRHLENRYGVGPTAQIFQRVGTMEGVGNPFLTTFYKDINIMHAVNMNKAKREVVTMMRTYFPEEIHKLGRRDYIRQASGAYIPRNTTRAGFELLTYLDNGGELKAFYVPKVIMEAFDVRNAKPNALTQALSYITIPFKDLVVNKNPGFMLFNSIRDYFGTANQLPGVGTNIFTIAQDWFKALTPAFRTVFGDSIPDDLRPLFKDKALISVALKETLTDSDKAFERILHRYHVKPKLWKFKVLKPFSKFFQALDDLNKGMERTAKIASYYHIKRANPNLGKREVARLVRTLGGSPAFLRRGRAYNTYNNLFVFSNAIKEGIRSSVEATKKSPGSFAVKTFGTAIVPKLLMYGGIIGVFGSEAKDWWQKVPEYDLANYDIIPLGTDENDKPIYLRVPKHEFDRLVGGLFWKALNVTRGADEKGVQDVLNYAGGQIPTLNPVIKGIVQSFELAGGRNPFDSFRNQHLIPDKVFNAYDMRTVKYFLKAQWNQAGGSVFFKFNTTDEGKIKSEVEKVLGMPGISNIIGRFIKVSDRGIEDKLRKEEKEITRDRARTILDIDQALLKLSNDEELTKEESAMLRRENKATLKKKIIQLNAKKRGNRRLGILKGSKSKAVKRALLRKLDELEAEGEE